MESMSTCGYMNCWKPIEGMALICDDHRAQRVKECKQQRTLQNYEPNNRNCTYGHHNSVDSCPICARGGLWDKRFNCKPCDKCHYCGEVHPFAPAGEPTAA
jgi:uncharacterized protein (DUF983 family)